MGVGCVNKRHSGTWCQSRLAAAVVLAVFAGVPAFAQDKPEDEKKSDKENGRLVTLEDLRRALQQSEADEKAPKAADGSRPESETSAPAVPAPSPTITLDQLRLRSDLEKQSQKPEDAELPGAPESMETSAPAVQESVSPPARQPQSADISPSGQTAEPADCDCPPPPEPEPAREPESEPAYVSDPGLWECRISTNMAASASGGFDEDRGKLSLYFDSSEFALNQAGLTSLSKEAERLQKIVADGDQIAIVGYSDGRGNTSANVIMSLQRAYNTKACIMQLIGIEERHLRIYGHGEVSVILEPMEPTDEGNRRADILPLSTFRQRFEDTFSKLNR